MGKGSITQETNSSIRQKGMPRKQEKNLENTCTGANRNYQV